MSHRLTPLFHTPARPPKNMSCSCSCDASGGQTCPGRPTHRRGRGPGDDAGVLGAAAGGQAGPQAGTPGQPAPAAARLGADRPAGRAGRARPGRAGRRHRGVLHRGGRHRRADRRARPPDISRPGRCGWPGRGARPGIAATLRKALSGTRRCPSGWSTSRWPPSTTTGLACGWSGESRTGGDAETPVTCATMGFTMAPWVSLDVEGLRFPFSPSRSRSRSPTSWLTGPRGRRCRSSGTTWG